MTACLLLLTGCTETRVSIGEAYVAPATLHVRGELSSKSSTVAELRHGDHLEILDVQRRMVKVRTNRGAVGWVDALQLLSVDQMEQLKQRRQAEAALSPEGSATAYEVLNIHIDPDRQAPAFAQIAEGSQVTVLGHKVTPKNTLQRLSGIVMARPQTTMSRRQRREQQARAMSLRLPRKPAPPKPPANWQQLSAERIDGGNLDKEPVESKKALPISPQKTADAAAKPPVLEDWTLIRTRHNETGWVLSRNLLMSIPDEVAQYAEGKRITAFFELGAVNDEFKGVKHNWLWTTAARALPFDFDSWRVFLWNSHKHRYETSYRKRDIEGYFPVRVEPAEAGSSHRMFQIITKDADGKMRRRAYVFDGHLVHLTSTEAYSQSGGGDAGAAAALSTKDLASRTGKQGWFSRQ